MIRTVTIAIDGPAGSGKSTLARGLSRELGIAYLNTGATYRALAIKALREKTNLDDEKAAADLTSGLQLEFIADPVIGSQERVLLDGKDITGELSGNEVSVAASSISRHRAVREAMVTLQRRMARAIIERESSLPGRLLAGVITEGRDAGTIIFPNADVKIFLTASLRERARRRMPDFAGKGMTIDQVMVEIEARDKKDAGRAVGPLKPAPDAVLVDNTGWTKEKTLQKAQELVREKLSC
jgi:cytidylate kinase